MALDPTPARITSGQGPLIATAIHDGHAVRPDLLPFMALTDAERLREEDPFTAGWTEVAPTRVVGTQSRFEVDLNRPEDGAVYLTPEQAWGLRVWKGSLTDEAVSVSLGLHKAFYGSMKALFDQKAREHGAFVVLDIHTYNHRRQGPNGPVAEIAKNPEVNIGTGTLADRKPWAALIDRFMTGCAAGRRPDGSHYDVRENVKFAGGYFGQWAHETYGPAACMLSIEFKKFFMDEWTGLPDQPEVLAIHRTLQACIPGLLEELSAVQQRVRRSADR